MALLLVACASKPPKPMKTHLNVAASTDVNPDQAGRPSPIVVRVYQLKDDAAFKDADFFAIFDKEQATLATSLISRQELVLAPGEQRTVDLPVSPEARFIGVAAAFRDIRNAEWRVLRGAPKSGIKNVIKTDSVSITLEKQRAQLAISD